MAKRLIPTLNRILVEKIVPPSKTNAGILLPEKTAQVISIPICSFCLVAEKLNVNQTNWHLVVWDSEIWAPCRTELGYHFVSQSRIWAWWVFNFYEPKSTKFDFFFCLIFFSISYVPNRVKVPTDFSHYNLSGMFPMGIRPFVSCFFLDKSVLGCC